MPNTLILAQRKPIIKELMDTLHSYNLFLVQNNMQDMTVSEIKGIL